MAPANLNVDFWVTDRTRKCLLIMSIGLVGSAFLLIFGISAVLNENWLNAAVIYSTTAVTLMSLLIMRITHNPAHGANGISIAVILVFTFLIMLGGVNGTGPLWCYPLTLIIMLLQGFKKGTAAAVLLLLITNFLMWVPDIPFMVATYSMTYKIRFIASFAALVIMSSMYEYLRWKSQKQYFAISEYLQKASRTDALTGLANRREMQERLEHEYSIFDRHNLPFSIVMVDLDYFKQINDRYGHASGDEVLVEIAALFTRGVRQQDLVARWGGEEFLILLPQTRLDEAILVAEKLRQAVDNIDFSSIGVEVGITASFGVQCVVNTGNLTDMLVAVDRMLYKAKKGGRNRVIGEYSSTLQSRQNV